MTDGRYESVENRFGINGFYLPGPRWVWIWLRRLIVLGFVLGVIGIIALWLYFAALGRTVPSIAKLKQYEPPITSRVHAGDGTLIAEFADQHRVFVPYESIPTHVVEAFVAAEDKNYFKHHGLDYVGILRGGINSVKNKITGKGGLQGGSTITQQVAKNMLLTRDQNLTRKAKEAIVAQRMEKEFTKGQILELYLNEIYLGGRSYGVGSAALNYFNKSLPELDLSEAAVLASLAKAPSAVNPYTNPKRLLARRNYVLGRMVEDGYITQEEADEAMSKPLTTTRRLKGPEYAAATYFVQELRRDLIKSYGEETLEQGGLSIRSTIDTHLQLAAQQALRNGLIAYDRRHGWRGPVTTIDTGDGALDALKEVKLPGGYGTWEAAMVQKVASSGATLLLTDGATIKLPAEEVEWAKTYKSEDGKTGLQVGQVILAELKRQVLNADETLAPRSEEVELDPEGNEIDEGEIEPMLVPVGNATLRQVPEVDGALIALDPHTGRILAMQGGYSFFKSSYNRVTQSKRQPGSSFKAFVYAAALEKGYTPATRMLDAPFVSFDVSTGDYWRPSNYTEGRSYGMVTLRIALEKSLNQVTARVAQDIGMEAVSDLAVRMGVYENLPPYAAMSLGAGDAYLIDMARGYAGFVNGGKKITPTLLDRVQDRHGRTLFRHDERVCEGCQAEEWDGQEPPQLAEVGEQVLDPIVAYQITHMLEGVVERGTGRRALRVGKPLAGKTGTTDDYRDAIFMGFSPDLVVGVRVGFDDNRSLGEGEAGGSVAAPIFTEFMEKALADQPAIPFRIPPGVRLVKIDARTGELPGPDTSVIIDEAFRPGTEPGLSVFNSSDDCLSISGSCGAGSSSGSVSGFDPERDAGVVPEDPMQPQEQAVTGDLDGTY
ncbi:penicillin-binding protein 1A [Hyphomonas jannaschiana]|uniref:Penicillin-binding protein 1A n=1 Tax=Hyphomonas jannaschiana VP2 TaxID=1280952 RepID=A0A059FG87_9PROT|nr:penicillin-binding protein 1A [Hyphomonas jannaschiana]KCZ89665.1 penicillin-binding protein 1A [Hyphomonas jannaschiana VP2]